MDTDAQCYRDHTPLTVRTYVNLLSMRKRGSTNDHRLVKIGGPTSLYYACQLMV